MNSKYAFDRQSLTLTGKLFQINWGFLFLIILMAIIGFLALYSAANGNVDPWAMKHAIRFSVGLVGLFIVALIDIRIWLRLSYLIYGLVFVLLIAVEVKGHIGMGAQRWINLGFIQLQPSELMKVAVVMALARFFNSANMEDVRNPFYLIKAAALALAPAFFVLLQPDLGTSLMIIMAALAMFFLVGMSYWVFAALGAAGIGSLPIIWHLMHNYQKKRVLTFLNPESDPLGSGYHIMQSKIALGSGGLKGKGFLQGTQSHLNFLPEKQTDFIFTLLAEEWGLLGGVSLLALFASVCAYGFLIAFRSHNQFGRLLAAGLIINFALYVFINIAMVMGLIPIVGVPLPMISNGGTAMMSTLFAFGLVMSVYIHRDVTLGRRV